MAIALFNYLLLRLKSLHFAVGCHGRRDRPDQTGKEKGAAMIPVDYYIRFLAILFTIGALGVLIRRNPLIIFMSIELMLNAANLAFVAFGSVFESFSGQIFVFFVIAVAAAEVAVGLALIVEIFKVQEAVLMWMR
jgi:NADH-quinone oxidoreductase subunit K